MALRWEELTITHEGRRHAGRGARTFLEQHHAEILPERQPFAESVVLSVRGVTLVNVDALEYLRLRLGAALAYAPRPQRQRGGGRADVRRGANNPIRQTPPVYAVTLSLGDIDALFDPLPDDAERPWRQKGAQQRLQALGYLYTPLGHSKIASHAHRCWEHYKAVHTGNAGAPDDAALIAILKREVQNNIVAGAFPDAGEVLQDSALPRAGEFAAIRFPGGYCFTRSAFGARAGHYTLGAGPPSAADDQYDFEIGADRFLIEEIMLRDNPLIGKIPLIAKVERVWPDLRRSPAPGVGVYIQLRDPDDPAGTDFCAHPVRDTLMDYGKNWVMLHGARPNVFRLHKGLDAVQWAAAQQCALAALAQPAGAARDAVVDGFANNGDKQAQKREVVTAMLANGPPYEVTGIGPRRFVTRALTDAYDAARALDATDPQRANCPHAHGGKAGLAVGTGAFETPNAARDGFHTRRDDQVTDFGALELATLAALPHKYAMRCVTNDQGYAGVVFTPSRCGGDRYKLRAYVDPDWLEGQAARAPVETETGTLVVWRNVRLHRYVQKPTPARAAYSPAVVAMLAYPKAHPLAGAAPTYDHGDRDYAKMFIERPVIDLDVYPGAAAEARYPRTDPAEITISKKFYRPVDVDFIGFAEQLHRGYCELLDDSGGREVMQTADLRRAIDVGRRAAIASGIVTTQIDWDLFLFHDMTSPFLINWRSFAEYNHLKGAALPALSPASEVLVQELERVANVVVEAVLESFAGGGVLPGLTLVQVPRGESWDGRALNHMPAITSGYACVARAGLVSHTDSVYRSPDFIYSASSNAAHELGHVLSFCHQPPLPGGDPHLHQGQPQNELTTPGQDDGICVMSYFGCYGEFCGRCVMSLRGWKVRSTAYPAGI